MERRPHLRRDEEGQGAGIITASGVLTEAGRNDRPAEMIARMPAITDASADPIELAMLLGLLVGVDATRRSGGI